MNYKEKYRKHFNLAKDDWVACTICNGTACDLHHVEFRSQGGNDEIENLISLCRSCHDKAHGKVKGHHIHTEDLERAQLKKIQQHENLSDM